MPSYLTTADVAMRLGVSLDTVRRWLRSGELKGAPFGRAGYRIENADFQAFLQHRQRHAQGESQPEAERTLLPKATLETLINAAGQELHLPLVTTHNALQQAQRLLQRALDSASSAHTIDQLTKLQDLLTWTEQQIKREMRRVENLLDASRIEAATFTLAPIWCNLLDIVQETVSSQQALAGQRRFEISVPTHERVAVIADVDRIREALTHYLTNALIFSPADQPIKVAVEVAHGEAQVSVQDFGSGIPEAEQGLIWERFQQGTRGTREVGKGLGLGLYLTRAIILLHHGQVGVESHVGEGSLFWFTLPLVKDS